MLKMIDGQLGAVWGSGVYFKVVAQDESFAEEM
jgi:hypothetical protein